MVYVLQMLNTSLSILLFTGPQHSSTPKSAFYGGQLPTGCIQLFPIRTHFVCRRNQARRQSKVHIQVELIPLSPTHGVVQG